MVFKLPFALFLQARNRPVGQSQFAWNAARATGNPVYPHGGSSYFMQMLVVKKEACHAIARSTISKKNKTLLAVYSQAQQ